MRRHTLGDYLRQKRLEADLSQNEVGRELGYHGQFVSNWENNKASPPAPVWRPIMKLYGIPMQELLKVLVDDSEKKWKEVLSASKKKKSS